ncbi:MAG: hypothetical protein JRC89_04955 [Deltaproteobacteria bacterium]|nr:hypothetical protein [Deltaproteobacteria bacterium]
MKRIRKIPTEREMIEQLRMGRVSLPPLSFRLLKGRPQAGGNLRFDAMVEASWGENIAKFAVECKSLSTPKAFQDGLNLLKTSSLPEGCRPLLFVPFLSERQLQELEREKISGIDLCGNGVVVIPEMFAVFRSGEKNRFTSSAPIKNIYRKNSSMVGQVFLLRSGYETVQDVCAEINRRNLLVKRWDKKAMSLTTVSKALKTLQEDLIISREDTIRLLQPDKLLQKLSENYAPPNIKERIRLKVPEKIGTIEELLRKESQELGLPLAAAGMSSVSRYAVMQRGDLLSIYCPRLDILPERLSGSQSDRFPNLELIETKDETVYFDNRQEENFWWASPVQVYLELMAGDKRDQETAEQVKTYIINNL